jgi:hypothetical protein
MKQIQCSHRMVYILDSGTKSGRIKVKCMDCPHFLYVIPKSDEVLGYRWRCFNCNESYTVDEGAARMLHEPLCLICRCKKSGDWTELYKDQERRQQIAEVEQRELDDEKEISS